MSELTYILGAGASYQSIPIVKTFSNRFKEFLDWIDKGVIKGDFLADKKQKFGILHKLGEDLHQSFQSHQSFDTYFKKLFHTGRNDKICQGKKILNVYFTWEHLSKSTVRPNDFNENVFWKQSSIDKRYDALIAGLLKPLPNKKEPYCKVNFITWNYDLNLLISLKNYFLPEATIGDFLGQINKGGGGWEIEDKISVINMNGYFYSSYLSDLKNLDKPTIHDTIYNKIKTQNYLEPQDQDNFIEYTDNSDSDAESIKFAWETNDFNGEIAKDKIKNSSNVVIIGYTFPLYNRSIDLGYFNNETLYGKRIILQDPNAMEMDNDIMENFSLKPQNLRSAKIISKINCDNFFIPNDIFPAAETR